MRRQLGRDPMVEAIRGHAVAKAYRRKAKARYCAICAVVGTDTAVARFSLVVSCRRPDGKLTRRGAGGINLCQPCWRKVARLREKVLRPDDRRRLSAA